MWYSNLSPTSVRDESAPLAIVAVVTFSLIMTPGGRGSKAEQVVTELVTFTGEDVSEVDATIAKPDKCLTSTSACTRRVWEAT